MQRASHTRSLTRRPRQRGRRTQPQSHLRVQAFKPGYRWRLSKEGGRRRGNGTWFRRGYRIGKPARSEFPRRRSTRLHFVSLGPWPKNTNWGSQQLTTHSLENINWDWVSNFPTLEVPKEMQNWTSLDTDQVMRYFGGLPSGPNDANERWIGLQDYDDDDRLWRNVMLWCLKYRKKQALMLLFATFKGHRYRPPRYVVSDSLEFLTCHFLFKVPKPSPMAVDAIWLLTRKFIEGAADQKQRFAVPQHVIYCNLKHSDDLRVLSFYWLLSLNKTVLHVDTMLHFLVRFIDMGRINLSMKLLGTIVDTGFDLSYDPIQMACAKLLRVCFDTQTEYTVRSNILARMLEMGVRPKIHLFNIILLNAGEGGDFANAWQMYGLAKKNALTPDSITYGVLLKAAVLSGNSSDLKMVIHEIQTNKEMLQDLRLVSNVLHAISLLSPGDEFGAMLDFYKQHCDLRPLQQLSLCGDETQAPPDANSYGVWPTSYILTRMILAYVRRHQGSLGLIHNYNLYYHYVKENHPLIAPLAQEDCVANAFIMAFGKVSGTLQHCITVVKHMLELSSRKLAPSDTVAYMAPTVQTWSILVAAYFRNNQRRAAEKVVELMRERGIAGDRVTWNTLISGYAYLQDVNATVDTVKKMEAAGLEADDYTTKALGKFLLRDRLMEALDTSTKEALVNHETPAAPLGGSLPPLDSEEQYEAHTALEWESRISNRGYQVTKYLEAKSQEQLDTDSENPSDILVATA